MAVTLEMLRPVLPGHVAVSSALGAGGQGAVFKGTCNGNPAAIKAFQATTDGRRIERECSLLSKLTCPHVVRLLEHFPVTLAGESVSIVVYEYHDGGDLMPHLQAAAPPLTEQQLVAIGAQVGRGIETLWGSRIIHRDIKPANIVRASDGRHLLVDVGFARHLDLSEITAAGGAPGTRGFRSPEQARGRRALTVHSDVYSLGVTLYCLAAKRHPFMGNDVLAPTPLNTAPMKAARPLSDGLIKLVRQMMDFTPARRPSDLVARFTALEVP